MSAMLHEDNVGNWQVFPDTEAVANAALHLILQAAEQAIASEGIFRIVLAGGTTPEKVYRLLVGQACDWQRWQLYLGDERCLAQDDPERNSVMIRQCLLDKVGILPENIHFIPAELGAEAAAATYAAQLADKLPFHLVMLGMGEDGHTASLFPGHVHNQQELVHAVHNAPKPPPERVSLSQCCLSQTQRLLILVTGVGKHDAVKQWQAGHDLPVARITSYRQTDILLDKAAAGA